MAGPPVIQPKAGVVKAPELSPYYSIYISWSLSACSLGFALSTLSPHYIYIYTRWRHSVPLLGFAIFTVSDPLHQI